MVSNIFIFSCSLCRWSLDFSYVVSLYKYDFLWIYEIRSYWLFTRNQRFWFTLFVSIIYIIVFWSLSPPPPPIQRVYLDLTQFFFFFLNFFNFHSLGICTNLNIFCLNDGMLHRLWGNEWKPRTWNVPIPIVRNGDISENIWENKYWSCCW